MRKFTSADAKNHFGVLVDAARVAPIAITKYARPFVVVMAVEEYERLAGVSDEPASTKKLASHAKRSRKKAGV
jgi:prevent-host-death family protein